MLGATGCVHELLAHKGTIVVTVDASASVYDAVVNMNLRHIGSLLVIDDDTIIGILTERDVLVRVVGADRDPHETRVRDVMTPDLIVIDPKVTVGEAMVVVTSRRCRHLPVFDRGRLCGIVSAGDLSAWLVREQTLVINELHDYIVR